MHMILTHLHDVIYLQVSFSVFIFEIGLFRASVQILVIVLRPNPSYLLIYLLAERHSTWSSAMHRTELCKVLDHVHAIECMPRLKLGY